MNAIDTFKMDKSVLSVVSLSGESDEKEYWHAKTPQERLAAVELMRQINYGYNPTTTRLQRVLEVAQLEGIRIWMIYSIFENLASPCRVGVSDCFRLEAWEKWSV